MGIPLPPKLKSAKVDDVAIPVPAPIAKRTGEVDDDDVNYILDTCLRPVHRKEDHVIKFIESFVRCKSILQASQDAGIHHKLGYTLRHKSDISNAIQKLTDKSLLKYGFDASEIFERVKEIVEFDPIMLQNADGTFKSNLRDIDPAARRNLKKLKVKNLYDQQPDINGVPRNVVIGEVIEYEFYDKLKAAELTGREKEMFKNTTKVEHTLTKDMQNILLESAKRADERLLTNTKNTIDIPAEDILHEPIE